MPATIFLMLLSVGIREDKYPMRSGCSAEDSVVAELRRGDEIQVRFAINGEQGPCYKVSTAKGDGYLPASALSSTEDFEKARQAGAILEIAKAVKAEALQTGTASGDANHPLVRASRFLDDSQPGQALELLKTTLNSGWKDPQVLALAGVAAYRSDDVKSAVRYWRESLELRPNAAIQQMYTKALKEAGADLGTERKFGSRFVLRFDSQSAPDDVAREMLSALEEEYSTLTASLGCVWQERVAAIVQTPEIYRQSSDTPNWSAGRFDGRIRIALLEGGRIGPKTQRAFAHELTHACLASTGKWPLWLHEGLAQKMSGDTLSPARRQQVSSQLRAGQLPRIDRLTHEWMQLSAERAALAYGLALAAVEVFYQDYSQTGIRNLLNNPGSLPQVVDHLNRRLLE